MTKFLILLIVTLLTLMCCASVGWAADNKTLTAGSITVTYPPDLEPAAKKAADIASKSFRQFLDVHAKIARLLKDDDVMAKRITDLLSAPEVMESARLRIVSYRDKSRMLTHCFQTVKLIKTSDAKARGGVDAGILQIRYDKNTDDFGMFVQMQNVDESRMNRTYFPVLVNPDGTIRSADKIPLLAKEIGGAGDTMIPATVHETVLYVMSEELRLYHPFARWFNEGVSAWVTKKVIAKTDPTMSGMLDKIMGIDEAAKKQRAMVNLYSWEQTPFIVYKSPYYDQALEAACARYSGELVTKLLGVNGEQTLPKIMGDLKYNSGADSEIICTAISKVTKTDAMAELMQYVPQTTREGISSGQAAKLLEDAKRLTNEKKWDEAEKALTAALEMKPEDLNARLNLAWVDREVGEKLHSEKQIFLVAKLIKDENYTLTMFWPGVEQTYVLARLADLIGQTYYAKGLYEQVLSEKPGHEDAKRGLRDLIANSRS